MSPSELGEVEGTTKPACLKLFAFVVADSLFHADFRSYMASRTDGSNGCLSLP